MTLKIPFGLSLREKDKEPQKNPSILAREEEYVDDEEYWQDHVKTRRRSSSSSMEAALNSWITSVSSNLNGARCVFATRVKKFYSRDERLRKSMETPSAFSLRHEHTLSKTNSMNQLELRFGDKKDSSLRRPRSNPDLVA